jgi:hypothetical protein
MTGNYKVYLTAEQWARAAAVDDEIAVAIAKQQPELAEQIGIEVVTAEIVTVPNPPTATESPQPPAVRRRRKSDPKPDEAKPDEPPADQPATEGQ